MLNTLKEYVKSSNNNSAEFARKAYRLYKQLGGLPLSSPQKSLSHTQENTQARLGQQDLVSPESVVWGYRLFLDREPENHATVADKANRLATTRELRQEFIESKEFKEKNSWFYTPVLKGDEPRLLIENVKSEEDLRALFTHIQHTWQYLGETEPHWSVLSAEQFKQSNIHNSKDKFYDSGKQDVARLFASLDRNEIDYASYKSCLEYGCGLGRVTGWLSERFERVYGYDISKSHLQGAEEYLVSKKIGNVTLLHIQKVEDIMKLPKVDLIYSVIVLQHNPPPIIELIIKQFVKALNPGGVAYFQVPTYRAGYSFSLDSYFGNEALKRNIEMHVLPQRKVFEIVQEEGAQIVNVLEDAWAGLRYKELSNTFIVLKQ